MVRQGYDCAIANHFRLGFGRAMQGDRIDWHSATLAGGASYVRLCTSADGTQRKVEHSGPDQGTHEDYAETYQAESDPSA